MRRPSMRLHPIWFLVLAILVVVAVIGLNTARGDDPPGSEWVQVTITFEADEVWFMADGDEWEFCEGQTLTFWNQGAWWMLPGVHSICKVRHHVGAPNGQYRFGAANG